MQMALLNRNNSDADFQPSLPGTTPFIKQHYVPASSLPVPDPKPKANRSFDDVDFYPIDYRDESGIEDAGIQAEDSDATDVNPGKKKTRTVSPFTTIASRIVFSTWYTVVYVFMCIFCLLLFLWRILAHACIGIFGCITEDDDGDIYSVLDIVATSVLSLELMIRILATRKTFFRSYFNLFDFVILLASLGSFLLYAFDVHPGEKMAKSALLFTRYIVQLFRLVLVFKRSRDRSNMLTTSSSATVDFTAVDQQGSTAHYTQLDDDGTPQSPDGQATSDVITSHFADVKKNKDKSGKKNARTTSQARTISQQNGNNPRTVSQQKGSKAIAAGSPSRTTSTSRVVPAGDPNTGQRSSVVATNTSVSIPVAAHAAATNSVVGAATQNGHHHVVSMNGDSDKDDMHQPSISLQASQPLPTGNRGSRKSRVGTAGEDGDQDPEQDNNDDNEEDEEAVAPYNHRSSIPDMDFTMAHVLSSTPRAPSSQRDRKTTGSSVSKLIPARTPQ